MKTKESGIILIPFLFLAFFLIVIFIVIFIAVTRTTLSPSGPTASELAQGEIPPHVLGMYQQAASSEVGCAAIPWQIVAGIGKVESRHGTFGGNITATDGAVGKIPGINISKPSLSDIQKSAGKLKEIAGNISIPGIDDIRNAPSNITNQLTKTVYVKDNEAWKAATIPFAPDFIFGPPLDGTGNGGNTTIIRDPDGSIAKAVGPMQFLLETFEAYGFDGNSDGAKDPHNYFDAIHAATNLLCSNAPKPDLPYEESLNLSASLNPGESYANYISRVKNSSNISPSQNLHAALWSYNKSQSYAQKVALEAASYTTDQTLAGESLVGATLNTGCKAQSYQVKISSYDPSGALQSPRIEVCKTIATRANNMIRAAARDGIYLSGWGYRSHNRQIQLRAQNCGGSSNFNIYKKRSSACRPPTATPGKSNHESGLAIDFTYRGSTIKSRNTDAFRWLNANAATYGFKNLPSEPWHWSVNGK